MQVSLFPPKVLESHVIRNPPQPCCGSSISPKAVQRFPGAFDQDVGLVGLHHQRRADDHAIADVADARAVSGILATAPISFMRGTAIGAAQRVALALDRSGWPEIVGTISGDDTIFVATRSAGDQKTLLNRLRILQQ